MKTAKEILNELDGVEMNQRPDDYDALRILILEIWKKEIETEQMRQDYDNVNKIIKETFKS